MSQTDIYQNLRIVTTQRKGFLRRVEKMDPQDNESTYHSTDDSLQETVNILESLRNLIYLTRLECDCPELVRRYMEMSDERISAMVAVLQRDSSVSAHIRLPSQC